MPMSAATMAGPESPRKLALNGSSSSYFPSDCQSHERRLSEPPSSSVQSGFLLQAPILSKDDTHNAVHYEGTGRSQSTALKPQYTSRPRFDPRQLLDPKGYNATHVKKESDSFVEESKPPFHNPNSDLTNGPQKREQDENNQYGMGNMIERIHNITERQERPRKKLKTEKDDDEQHTKAGFSGGGKGGDISEYMKQKREEGRKDSGPSSAIVDLTEGELNLV